jgi:hypothetical protein
MGIKRVAGLAWKWLLMRVDNSTGKGTFSMDNISLLPSYSMIFKQYHDDCIAFWMNKAKERPRWH